MGKEKVALSDRFLVWQAKYLERNRQKSDSFTQNPNQTNPDNIAYSENTTSINQAQEEDFEVLEENLPVVQEAREKTAWARENGLFASKEINPFGENLLSITMYLFGDIHQPGSNPENSIIYKNKKPYKFLESILNMPRGRGILGIYNKLLGKDFDKWMKNKKPIMQVDSFRLTLNAISNKIKLASHRAVNPDSKINTNHPHIVVDLGDRTDTDSNMGDIGLNAVGIVEQLQSLVGGLRTQNKKSKFSVMAAFLTGNHDDDNYNHGIDLEKFQRELFGKPIFLQEVGGYMVLALNTNLYSSFWKHSVALERAKFEKIKEQSKAIADDELNPVIGKQIKRYDDFFITLEAEKTLQNKLIKLATQSEKKIAILAHEEDQVLKNLPLDNMNVTHIVAAHLHRAMQKDLKQKNAQGKKIRLVRVGVAEAYLDIHEPDEVDSNGDLIPQSGRINPRGISLPQSYELHIDGENLEVNILDINQSADQIQYLF